MTTVEFMTAALYSNTSDIVARLALADALEEIGHDTEADFHRWMVENNLFAQERFINDIKMGIMWVDKDTISKYEKDHKKVISTLRTHMRVPFGILEFHPDSSRNVQGIIILIEFNGDVKTSEIQLFEAWKNSMSWDK